tara:strand:+ start:405 stop:758 length:354 start_codon:yes stop_codon:yes gene_type:complete
VEGRLVVEFEVLRLALFDVVQVDVKDVREAGPQNVDRDFLKDVVENVYSVDSLHLFLAFLVCLDHYEARVEVVELPVTVLFKFVHEVLADDLTENLVEHVCLLSLVANFEVKELEDE